METFKPVLLGSDANVYGMARSFYEAYGVTSDAICKARLPATARSRLVHIAAVEPRLEEDEAFVATLRAYAQKQTQPLVLVPCADGYAALLTRHQAELAPYYRFACPAPAALRTVESKEAFYRACAAHGLRCPRTVVVGPNDWRGAALPFGWPAVVKASDSAAYWNCRFPHKKKVFLAGDRAELDAILAAIYGSSYRGAVILQEYIPGDDSCMRVINAYCGQDGKVRLLAMGRPLLEEQTPEGIGNYAAILTGPEVNDAGLLTRLHAFLEALPWRGFANFDAKYDAGSGEIVLFEMNPRQGRSSYYVTAAGCNLARFLVEDVLAHRPCPPVVLRAESLWTIAPFGVLRRYMKDRALLQKARRLRRKGRCRHQLFCRQDASVRRLAWYLASQANYYRKTARYYGNKALRG